MSAFVTWRVLRSRGARSMPSEYLQSRCAAGRHRSRVAAEPVEINVDVHSICAVSHQALAAGIGLRPAVNAGARGCV